jgi:hypothetical protein
VPAVPSFSVGPLRAFGMAITLSFQASPAGMIVDRSAPPQRQPESRMLGIRLDMLHFWGLLPIPGSGSGVPAHSRHLTSSPARVEYRADFAGLQPRITYTVEPAGESARSRCDPSGLRMLMTPMTALMVPRRNKVFVQNLKRTGILKATIRIAPRASLRAWRASAPMGFNVHRSGRKRTTAGGPAIVRFRKHSATTAARQHQPIGAAICCTMYCASTEAPVTGSAISTFQLRANWSTPPVMATVPEMRTVPGAFRPRSVSTSSQ